MSAEKTAGSVLELKGLLAKGKRQKAKAKAHDEEAGRDSMPGLAQLVLSGQFDVNTLLRQSNERGVDALRFDLITMDHRAVDELKRAVYEHYHEVMQACQAVIKLQADMSSLHKIISSSSVTLRALRDLTEEPLTSNVETSGSLLNVASEQLLWGRSASGEQWFSLMDDLDTAIAERHCDLALDLLRTADAKAEEIAEAEAPQDRQARMDELAAQLETRSNSLTTILTGLVKDPTCSRDDMLCSVRNLETVAGPVQAHAVLLEAHSLRIAATQAQLVKPQHAGGADAQGTSYAGALAQKTFFSIADALDDVNSVFGTSVPELGALLLTWALQETKSACSLLKVYALEQYAAPSGLGATVLALLLMMAHAQALEQSHALRLAAAAWKDLWPSLEQVLQRHLRKVEDEVCAAVEADIDNMVKPEFPIDEAVGSWEGWQRLFPNFRTFRDHLRALVTVLLPLASPQLGSFTRKGISEVFMSYTRALKNGMSKYIQTDGMIPESMGPATEMLMEGVTLLVEKILPPLMAPLATIVGDVIDVDHLRNVIDRTAEALGLVEVE